MSVNLDKSTAIADGDRVTLTRALPDGRVFKTIGTLTESITSSGRLSGGRITGACNGESRDGYYDLDAERMLRLYGVTQTLVRER